MNVIIPREHGGWAMVIVPFLLGLGIGGFNFFQILAFVGTILGYIGITPLLMMFRQKKWDKELLMWMSIYFGVAFLFWLFPIIKFPGLILMALSIIPFLLINLYFAKIRNERSVWNDFFAISGMSIVGIMAFYIGTGEWNGIVSLLWFTNVLYFMGSVFHVKSFIREKNNHPFKWWSRAYHLLILLFPLAVQLPMLSLSFVPSAIKSWVIPLDVQFKPIQTGIIEIVNSFLFVVITIFVFRNYLL
ncbi:YwiC-like family protein [Microaerobacter geothermalis]|uniref:YwiC-like family protein n=1 Tax=Microaerobacter geothermalis TaxID=674972 RepID=UPI001F27861E|nr:YwiC-like family protein [Microaerobacter geothermalis]MCF6094161.1 YwiC-like family protein [Microaerobacter geothermalis]